MKATLTIFVLVVPMVLAAAQTPKIKDLTPSGVRPLELSMEGEANYNKWSRLMSGKYSELTSAEKEFVDKYSEVFDESLESYWQTPPGGAGCSWYCAGGPSEVVASSELKSQGGLSYLAGHAHDFDYKNVWAEGVDGYGIGEYLLYRFSKNSPRVTTVIIANGHVKNAKAWKDNSRVKRLKMYVDGRPYAILNLEDSRSEQTFELGEPLGKRDDDDYDYDPEDKSGLALKFEIMEVYEGEKYDDTVIAELYFDGIDVHCFGGGTKVMMADGTEMNIEELRAGDAVASYDMASGKLRSAVIEGVDSSRHQMYVYSFRSGKQIEATDDHPFLLKGKSWASFAPEKSKRYKGYDCVQKVEIGDMFVTADGVEELVSIEPSGGTSCRMAYTITRLRDAVAFVANGLVVGVEDM